MGITDKLVKKIVNAMVVLSVALENDRAYELGRSTREANKELASKIADLFEHEMEAVVKKPFKIVDFDLDEIYGTALDRGVELVITPLTIYSKRDYAEYGEEAPGLLGTHMLYKIRDYIEPASEKDMKIIDEAVEKTEKIMENHRVFNAIMEAVEPEPLISKPLSGEQIINPQYIAWLIMDVRKKIQKLAKETRTNKSSFLLATTVDTEKGENEIALRNNLGNIVPYIVKIETVYSGAFEAMIETVEYVVKYIVRIYEKMVGEGIW